MGTKAQEMRDGCFAKAALDEPLFVLRAQDKTAPGLVRKWARDLQQHHIKAGTSGRPLAKAILKYTEALELADQMEAWSTRKQPD